MHRESALFIQHQPVAGSYTESVVITGHFETYVRCGSQLSVWGGFPMDIRFKVVDSRTGETSVVGGFPESVSWDQSVYEFYGSQPCDQRVRKEFCVDLVRDLGLRIPAGARTLQIAATYLGVTSNVLVLPARD